MSSTQTPDRTSASTEQRASAPVAALATPPAAGRRRVVLPIVLLALLAVGVAWGVKRWTFARSHETTDNAQVDVQIIPVYAKVGGYVRAVHAAENTRVAANAVLVEIDDAEYRVRMAQAEAELAAARATAGGGGGGTGQAEAQVQSATSQRSVTSAQIEAAQANLTKARADLERLTGLVEKQIASRQQLDAARAAAEAAEANVQALQRQSEAAGASVTGARAGVRLAEARLAAAQAARENAALQLSYARVVAPAAGIVARKQVEIGQLVQAGQPLLNIVPDSGYWVQANFKETQLAEIRLGQPVELEVDAYKGCTARGTVESFSPATGAKFALLPPDNATGNFTKVVQRVPVRVRITQGCGAERPLRPGMSVVASVVTRGGMREAGSGKRD